MVLPDFNVDCSEKKYIGINHLLLSGSFASVHSVQHVTQGSENLSEKRAVTILCEASCTHDCSQKTLL